MKGCYGMKHIALSLLSISSLFATFDLPLETRRSIVPHDKSYYTHQLQSKNIEIIYTKDNLSFAKETASIEESLHDNYENFFNWKLDETLYVGLISDNNQIANGFSTQIPNNRQINYIGGTEGVDYFSSTSWLDTLLYHETAHNYQLNVKGDIVSQSLHAIFGNLYSPLIIPNLLENSFMLEGNAVLNESWHGNGGRLYSGRFKALTLLQAKDNQLKPEYLYNRKLAFPYGEIAYIQGGFYNLYMAKHYGLKRINSYFKRHSQDFMFPLYTDISMLDSVGHTFVDSVGDFERYEKNLAKDLVEVNGEIIAKSQFFSSLGNSKNEIFFITNESGRRAPELVIFNKQTKEITKHRDSYLSGKVLKVDGEYLTQGSMYTSPIRIKQGLFNANGYIKEGTDSKMIQGYLSTGQIVYFDVASSYSQPQLYVGNKFYSQVNSSVFIDKKDNLYYFKQKGKIRTLYKNKTALYSYRGFYGIVSGVDSKDNIYFVANSQLGSTLYRYSNATITRVSSGDNIVEARVINDKEVLLAAVGSQEYYYVINEMTQKQEQPYNTKLFFEDKAYYGNKYIKNKRSQKIKKEEEFNLEEEYYSLFNMHYSSAQFSIGSYMNDFIGNLNINFEDPLEQNSANLFISKDIDAISVAGAGYSNAQYLLNYRIVGYGVIDKGSKTDIRDSGIMANAKVPFLKKGYWSGALDMSYYQDYDTISREPLSVTLSLSEHEQYGVSFYANQHYGIQLYGVQEREDKIVGTNLIAKHDLPREFYIGAEGKYSISDADTNINKRGVKLSSISSYDFDPSVINMASLSSSSYVQSAGYIGINLAKVLNFSAYFFTFPISLRRETLYTRYRYYDLADFKDVHERVNEVKSGMTFATVFINNVTIPINVEYIYNDASFVKDRTKFQFNFSSSF